MFTVVQNYDCEYDVVDESANHIVYTTTDLHLALTEMIQRNRNIEEMIKAKEREEKILKIALSWSDIQVAIEAEKRAGTSDFYLTSDHEATIRLEMAEIALEREENKIAEKRPLLKKGD